MYAIPADGQDDVTANPYFSVISQPRMEHEKDNAEYGPRLVCCEIKGRRRSVPAIFVGGEPRCRSVTIEVGKNHFDSDLNCTSKGVFGYEKAS